MTDQTTCPHCGAYRDNDRSGIWFDCGSGVVCDHPVNSTLCELRQLRAKVAAQQELLKEAADVIHGLIIIADHYGYAGDRFEGDMQKTQDSYRFAERIREESK